MSAAPLLESDAVREQLLKDPQVQQALANAGQQRYLCQDTTLANNRKDKGWAAATR